MSGNIFGTRLRQLRKDKNLTQSQLAKIIDVSTSAIGMYEQGRREPDNKVLSALCTVLDTTTDYLIGISAGAENPNQDVNDVIDDFTRLLASQSGLMFNGQPMSREDREKVIIAIKSAAAVVIPGKDK